MMDVIDIKTRRALHAEDVEKVLVPADAGMPSGLDPIMEEIVLRLQDMDDDGKRVILRKAIKLRNARRI